MGTSAAAERGMRAWIHYGAKLWCKIRLIPPGGIIEIQNWCH